MSRDPVINRTHPLNRVWRQFDLLAAGAILISGIVLGLLTITTHYLAVALAVGLFLILPSLISRPFRLYIWIVITWPVLTLYVRTSSFTQLPAVTYERLIVPLLVGVLLVEGLAFRKKLPSISVFLLLFLAAQILTRVILFFVGGTGKPEIVYLLNVVVMPITVYWATKAMITTPDRVRALLFALVIVSIIICLSGLYERAIDAQVSPFPIGEYSAIGQSRWLDVPGGRAAGIVGNPAVFGGIMGLGVMAGLSIFTYTQNRIVRWLMGAAILLLLYGVVVSFTRAAWLAVTGVLFVMQFKFGKLWQYTLPVFLLGGIGVLILLIEPTNSQVIQNRILNPATINARLEMARVALTEFVRRPVMGWGPEAYNQFIFDYVHGATQSFGASSSHNTYFTMLVDGGLVLLGSFGLMIGAFFWKAVRAIQQLPQRGFENTVVWVMAGSVMIYLLLGVTNDLRDFIYYNVLLFIAFAVIENLGRMGQAAHRPESAERRLPG